MRDPIQLQFSDKYDQQHAQEYCLKHGDGLARRLSHRRDEQLARHALAAAGEPGLVLDLPCGAGRFWPLLAEKANRVIIAADPSENMLLTAQTCQPAHVVQRVRPMQMSAFDITLPDNSVDSIFCMRLMQHVGEARQRMALLKEFRRVTRDTVILSVWVDGNFKAWRRRRIERRRAQKAELVTTQNRFVTPISAAESEFVAAGFKIEKRFDFIPLYAMWRVYVLRKVGP